MRSILIYGPPSKTYTTENAYRSHINSKKHKENELKVATKSRDTLAPLNSEAPAEVLSANAEEKEPEHQAPESSKKPVLEVAADATEEEVSQTIDEKIAAARSRLSVQDCLFCPVNSSSLEESLTHMSAAHSFFIPDADYLVDLPGLITYLGEKIAVGNVCIYCSMKSRDFRTLDAVRKHMLDKTHCKIAYDSQKERLEFSDFYDFSSSYPDFEEKQGENQGRRQKKSVKNTPENEEWEDIEDNGQDVDEVIEEDDTPVPSSDTDDSSSSLDEDELPGDQLTYGDSSYELVLPSGARIGHRSLRHYYAQSFSRASLVARKGKDDDPNSGAALVRRLIADKNSALVPRKGGFGAFGSGTDVVKARNRGEAREAGRHVREFRDQQRREQFKTRVGFIHNNQKHFRDPLLQASPLHASFRLFVLIFCCPVIIFSAINQLLLHVRSAFRLHTSARACNNLKKYSFCLAQGYCIRGQHVTQ